MGRARPYHPAKLADKLLYIRTNLDGGLSQDDMVSRLGMSDQLNRNYVSCFERGTRLPPLNALLSYARLISTTGGGEFLEALIDDDLDLPKRLPADPRVETIRRKPSSREKRRN